MHRLIGRVRAEDARALELSRNTVAKYKVEGAPARIGFACAALAFGLPARRSVAQRVAIRGASGSGGGIRTPDTRIMIPLL